MRFSDSTLFPEVANQQSEDNISRRRDEHQVVQANSGPRGDLEIVKVLVDKNPRPTQIPDGLGYTPLAVAAQYSNKEVVRYLCSKTNDDAPGRPFTGPSSGEVICALTCSGLYGEASESFQSSREKTMRFSDPTLFPEVANQQSEDNISRRRDELQVVKANSGPRVEMRSYLKLFQAAAKGDWGTIKSILDVNPNALTARIDEHGNTLLQVAVWMGHASVVQRLLELASPDELEKRNYRQYTALQIAAIGGDLEIVEALVVKNPRLTQIPDGFGCTPLMKAAQFSNKEVVRYLLSKTNDDAPGRPFTGRSSGEIICALTCSGFYDVALMLLRQYPRLAVAKNRWRNDLLTNLANKPSDFLSGCNFRCWELWIYQMVPMGKKKVDEYYITTSDEENAQHQNLDNGTRLLLFRKYMEQVLAWIKKLTWKVMKELVPKIKHIEQERLKHEYANKLIHNTCEAITNLEEVDFNTILVQLKMDLHIAAENGIVEIVTICCQYFPSLIWTGSGPSQTLFHMAAQHRREKIFNLSYTKNAISKCICATSNGYDTLLHGAARLAPPRQLRSIPCPAIQMQREIRWFKAVENSIQPYLRNFRNKDRLTPDNLFTKEHKELVEEAEKWMKDTSNSCMLVSTLIATVVFAAAFTVPGGNLEGKGVPIFLKEATFITFAISDALALFFSTTSILMFLSILTARYAEQDFLYALPRRLILGLASLFIAIAAMMVAFGSALQIMLGEKWEWIYIPTMVLGALPVSLFMMLQFPLFVEMIWSTYGPSIFRPEGIW